MAQANQIAVIEDVKPNISGSGIPIGSRADMFPASPLPELNGAGGPAFAARVKNDASSDLFAVLCNGGLPARLDIVNGMRGIDHPAVLRLVDSGVVAWPDGARYPAFAYQRPTAPRLMRTLDETHTPMMEDAINRRFIQPLVGALSEFQRTGVVHGAIRPTNIFWRMGSTAAPQLGECLSAPSGMRQPVLFETIERGMCMPIGRGSGTHADDCYAFGVTIALFILGQNPLKGLDDATIVRTKMEQGTFNTLVGHHRLAPNHIELLRGLLTDDPHQRWSAADLEQWLSGRRLTPKSSDAGKRSSRHIDFCGKEDWQVRPLAMAFAAHVSEAGRVIENHTLDRWLRRSLVDEDRADDVADAAISLREHGKHSNYEEQLVSRVCIALDPTAPIRYRGLSVMPGGIASMLAQAMSSGGSIDVLVDIIGSQIVNFWVDMQKHLKPELVPVAQQFDRLANVIEKTSYGNGVERAVYEINPTLPCLSPILQGQYVTTAKGLLTALERVAGSGARAREPMDRHIAAFLIVRDRRSEVLMETMAAPETSPRRAMAMLTLFSEMQNRHGPDSLPRLAQWLAPLLEPATKRYLGKSLRENVQRQIREATEHGDIGALTRILDNPQRTQRDEQDFVAARLLYFTILKEINSLEGRMANRERVVESVGKPAAAAISGMVAFCAVLLAIARAVWSSM